MATLWGFESPSRHHDPVRIRPAIAFLPCEIAVSSTNPFASVRRLDPCPCGSGKRFRDCHGRLAPAPVLAQAIALRERGDTGAARESLRPLLEAPSPLAEAFNLDGLLAQDELDLAGAKSRFRRALELAPDFPEAHFNLGLALLLEGDYERGWPEYEWRTRRLGYGDYANYPFGMPRWRGEPLSGRSILVHAEQGQGDTIQFARFLGWYAEEGATIDVFCQPPLVSLMGRVPGVRRAFSNLAERPAHDFHAPIIDAGAHRLRSRESPHWRGRYLAPIAERTAKWSPEIDGVPRPRTGLVWKGSARHANDRRRSLPPALAARLAEGLGGAVGLQVEDNQAGTGIPLALEVGSRIADWEDTAAIISRLDLVITVDTAVAHLAGALGKSVWTLLPYSPDWRWGIAGATTAWYPSMRLFRQARAGDWDSVIDGVLAELALRLR